MQNLVQVCLLECLTVIFVIVYLACNVVLCTAFFLFFLIYDKLVLFNNIVQLCCLQHAHNYFNTSYVARSVLIITYTTDPHHVKLRQ